MSAFDTSGTGPRQPRETLMQRMLAEFVTRFFANCFALVIAGAVLFFLLHIYVGWRIDQFGKAWKANIDSQQKAFDKGK